MVRGEHHEKEAAMTITDPIKARQFINSIELPSEPEFGLESAARGAEAAAPPTYDNKDQAVAVGSQIAEFSDKVPVALRPAISNSFLLAQLAANKEITKNNGNTLKWYAKYNEVLANVGWIIEGSADSFRSVRTSGLQVHKEILPVIAAALGPAVAAAAVVTATLNGLANMNKDSPWITLFDRESQRAQANQFQIAYVDAPNSAAPVISLACFELDASRSVTQVLFFKFSDAQATLRNYSSKLSMNQGIFESVQGAVQQRVASFVSGYVAGIDL
jgi:hypothetical protein